jgi:uncharacterized membrane-anchored protein YitT (DUF2179 family)
MKKFSKKLNSFAYQHIWLKYILDYGFAVLATVFSAFIFVFGMLTFLEPALSSASESIGPAMVSGGSSGAAQVIKLLIFSIFKNLDTKNERIILSSLYLLINIPLLVLAFKGVGLRFAIFTLLNVGCVFLFTNTLKGELVTALAEYVSDHGGMLTRALFAGMCTGISSGIAYKIDSSAGGFDIISFYISAKKSTLAGKYGMIINGIIVASFALVSGLTKHDFATAIGGALFSFVYLLAVMLVIDVINIRNKKAKIEVTTSKKDLPQLLIANIPHGATLVEAKGAFTDNDRLIIEMVVSTTEIKRSVNIIKTLDPESFVVVTSLSGVYGNFHMKPIK